MTKRCVLIDGTNYAFRSFYAIPILTNSSGFPTNALHGFVNLLLNYVNENKPDYLIVAFDSKEPSIRKESFDNYKSNRKECPADLAKQLPLFKDIANVLNIPFLERAGYEADDIIATIARQVVDLHDDIDVEILSMDKDLMQLVTSRISLIDGIKNKVYKPDDVFEKWGVFPDRLKDLLALTGDSSDNIPGVAGIGPKKALELLNQFESVPSIIENKNNIKNEKIRKQIENGLDALTISYQLVTLHYDVPVSFSQDSMRLEKPDYERCSSLFTELGFNRILKSLSKKEKAIDNSLEITRLHEKTNIYKQINRCNPSKNENEYLDFIKKIDHENSAIFITDKKDVDKLWIAFDSEDIYEIELASLQKESDLYIKIKFFFESGKKQKIGFNVKKDWHMLNKYGIALSLPYDDIQLASYLLYSNVKNSEIALLLNNLLNIKAKILVEDDGTEKFISSASYLFDLCFVIKDKLDDDFILDVYKNIEIPLLSVLAEMEFLGVRIDVKRLKSLSVDFETRLNLIESNIMALAGENFNANSPKQLQVILFQKLKLPIIKTNKTGPSTDHEVLEELAEYHQLPAEILNYRSLAKLKNTYIDTLPKQIAKGSDRIHTTFNQTVTATGRLSSSDPNLQNIPIRGEDGRKIREVFVPKDGFVLVSADYSQIELRLLAHFSGDEPLIETFNKKIDIHTATASEMFSLEIENVTQDMRRSAKSINFGILYGMGAFSLAKDLNISRREAEDYINRYFKKYPKVRVYLDKSLYDAKKNGYTVTLWGRRRYLPELKASQGVVRKSAERMAINAPIQGSSADIIKIAMCKIDTWLKSNKLESKMILQVHDELVFEVKEDEKDIIISGVKDIMESVCSLKVPLVVDVGIGNNWSTAH